MRARTVSALCGIIGVLMVGGAVVLTGCASGHKDFAYTVGQGSNEIFEFRAQRDGTLLPLGTPNFPAGSNPASIAVHTNGNFLYIADFAGNNLTLLDINKGNGNLSVPVSTSVVAPVTPPNIFNTGVGPISVAMSQAGPFLYVANQTEGNITAFTVVPGNGSLNFINNFTIAPVSQPQALAISPKGDFLFTANPTQGTVAVFAIASDGKLTQAGAAVSMGAGATPNAVVVDASGKFLYVADGAHSAVLAFAIQSGGTLTAISGSPFAAGLTPSGLAIDPQGTFLFVANTGSNNVSAYVIDHSTGALGAATGSPFPTGGLGPAALAVDANSTVLYVAEQTSHDIASFGIFSGGVLKAVKGSPFSVATAATAITVVQR